MLHTLLYFLALVSLSTSAIWAKLNQMPSEILGFWRLLIAGVLLFAWVFAIRRKPLPKFDTSFYLVTASGLFFFLHLWTYKYAAKTTLIANMTIIFATNPLWSALGSILFFKGRLTRRMIFAYVLGVLAVFILVYKNIQFGGKSWWGDLSALSSALFFSCYMLTSKGARRNYDNSVFATFQYLICAGFFFVGALATQAPFFGYSDASWWGIAALVAFPTFVGHFSSTYLVSHMDFIAMSCGKLIEPALSALWAFLIFHETLQLETLLAFLLTVISVVVLFAPGIRSSKNLDKST